LTRTHLARFIVALVREQLDLAEITSSYRSSLGQPPFDPRLMVALLLYAYCNGIYSSRRIAKACRERVDFMSIVALDPPDFRTISDFRKRHLQALSALFVQVLKLCEKAGLVKLGHVALDGTKMKALEAEARAAAEVRRKAEAEAEEQRRQEGCKKPGKPAALPTDDPHPKAQKNFTDPESRIMKTKDGFIQGYNGQAAVDGAAQVIVAHDLDAQQSDQHQLAPMTDAVTTNLGRKPEQLSADAGYCSDDNLAALEQRGIDAYIATGRAKHAIADTSERAAADVPVATAAIPPSPEQAAPATRIDAMREKIKAGGYESPYRLRKQLPEPVFGQIKQARGFRQFLLRGVENVRAEWAILCTVHNLLKLAGALKLANTA